jgi:hypothetical protein
MPARTHREWEALADFDSARLVKPIESDVVIRATNVDLREDVLVFETPAIGRDARRSVIQTGSLNVPTARVPSDLLERFLSLGTHESILRFARRYGPLGAFGRVHPYVVGDKAPWSWSFLKRAEQGQEYAESVRTWLRFKDHLSCMLALAADWRDNRIPDADVLRRATELDIVGSDQLDRLTQGPTMTRRREIGRLLTWGACRLARQLNLRPGLRFDPASTHVDLVFQDYGEVMPGAGISLMGALSVQFFAAMSGSGFAVCSACGSAFVPRRRPAADRRRYCAQCGRKAALRDAKAEYRRTLRELKIAKMSDADKRIRKDDRGAGGAM